MRTKVTSLFLLFYFIFSNNLSANIQQDSSPFLFEVKNRTIVSLRAQNISFKTLVKQLEDKTNLRVKIFEGVKEKNVSININSIPFYAIDTIFKKIGLKNSAIVYDKKSDTMVLYVLPEGKDLINELESDDIIIGGTGFSSISLPKTVKNKNVKSITKGIKKRQVLFIEDEIIFKFHRGISDEERDRIQNKYGLKLVDKIPSPLGYVKAKVSKGEDPIEIIKKLRGELSIKEPEPNYILNSLTFSSNYSENQWHITDIGFDKAWEEADAKEIVKVAVIDSGIDSKHPEFTSRVLNGFDFVNEDNEPVDDNGHGTFVAGIIGAAGNNDLRITGLNNLSKIIPVKVIDKNGFGTCEDVAKGILFAADNGAKVINLSIGMYASSSILKQSIDYAFEKGCIVVAAGGNDGIENFQIKETT